MSARVRVADLRKAVNQPRPSLRPLTPPWSAAQTHPSQAHSPLLRLSSTLVRLSDTSFTFVSDWIWVQKPGNNRP